MDANDQLLRSISARLVDLSGYDDELTASVAAILEQLEADVVAALRAIDPASPGALTYRQARLERLLEQTRAMVEQAYGRAIDATHAGLERVGQAEFDFVQSSISAALEPLADIVDIATVTVSPEILSRLARESLIDLGEESGAGAVGNWFRSQAVAVQDGIATQLRLGVLHGEGMQEMVRRIAGGGAYDGVLPGARGWADVLVRTGVTEIVDSTHIRVFQENRQTLRGMYQITFLDGRNTDICIAYAGKGWVFGKGEEMIPVGHSLPFNNGCPRHARCRSTTAPWVKSWEEMGIAEDELPAALRNQFSGKIPARIDGQSQFEKATEASQNAMVGKGRAQLIRDGRIKVDDLVDSKGRNRSLRDILDSL